MNLYLASTRVTSGQGIILLLFVVVGIMSASALTFGLVSSGTLWWARPLTGWLTAHRYRNFLEIVYWSCMKMGSRCAFSTTEFQHTMGKCRVVADRDKSCYSYGVTIVWCFDVLRHMTVTCKTTVFENTVFDFQFAACLAKMRNLQTPYQNKEALYLDNWVVLRIVTLVWDIILVVLLKSKVKVSQGVPGRLRPRIISTFQHYKGGRSSAKRTGRLYPRRNPCYSLSEAESTSVHMVLWGVPRKKSPVAPPGIDSGIYIYTYI
jgi:hypothetical protein